MHLVKNYALWLKISTFKNQGYFAQNKYIRE